MTHTISPHGSPVYRIREDALRDTIFTIATATATATATRDRLATRHASLSVPRHSLDRSDESVASAYHRSLAEVFGRIATEI